MGTTVTRDEALLKYAGAMLLISRGKRKHLRLSRELITYVQQLITPVWQYLTESERISFLFAISERKILNTRYVGPVWKIAVATWWLKDKAADLAAEFIIHSDKRLN